MAMPIPPDDNAKPKRPLPPELVFLNEFQNFKELERDEKIDWMRRRHKLIRQNAALISEYGMDPDTLLAFTEPTFLAFEKAQKDLDEAQQRQFHLLADLADAQHDLFKTLEAIVNPAYEKAPFDPEVQEAKEFLEEWRKEMPKE